MNNFQCQMDVFSESEIGYVIVPIDFTEDNFCGKLVKSEGKCGETKEECSYEYYHSNNQLVISGRGKMTTYSNNL